MAEGDKIGYEKILAELKRRDTIDTERTLSPLGAAPQTKTIDTEGLSVERVAANILTLVGEKPESR